VHARLLNHDLRQPKKLEMSIFTVVVAALGISTGAGTR